MSGPSTGAGFAAAFVGLLVAVMLGLVLLAHDPADEDIAPPAASVLVELDGQPIAPPAAAPAPMTCDELRAGRDRWLLWASREALGVETRKGFAATALAWATAAAAECEP